MDFDDLDTLWVEPDELAWQRASMRTVHVRLSAAGLVGLEMCTLHSGGSKSGSTGSDRPCKAPVVDLVVHNVLRGRNPFLDHVVDDGHLGLGSVIKYINGRFVDSAATFKLLIGDAVQRQKTTGYSVMLRLGYLPAHVTGHVLAQAFQP